MKNLIGNMKSGKAIITAGAIALLLIGAIILYVTYGRGSSAEAPAAKKDPSKPLVDKFNSLSSTERTKVVDRLIYGMEFSLFQRDDGYTEIILKIPRRASRLSLMERFQLGRIVTEDELEIAMRVATGTPPSKRGHFRPLTTSAQQGVTP